MLFALAHMTFAKAGCPAFRQFSKDIGEWLENQILIPDWTYFHCPGATLVLHTVRVSNSGQLLAPPMVPAQQDGNLP